MVCIASHLPGTVEMALVFFVVVSLLATIRSPVKVSCSANFQGGCHGHQLNGSAIHLQLHHPQGPCSPLPLLPLIDILKHDELRVRSLTARLGKKTSASNRLSNLRLDSTAVPVQPGIALGVGNYITYIGLGTPAATYPMVVDTGSSLTWLQCSPCRISCHPQSGPFFDPSASATYRTVPCSASECTGLASATLNPSACSFSNVCIYEASYGDSSFSAGYLSRDTLILGSAKVPGFLYGCGQDNQGLFGRSAGLIGLARNKLSFQSQLSSNLGNSFAYCLPTADSDSAGFLSVGSYDPSKFTFTPMLTDRSDDAMYFLRLTGIAVGGKAIAVPASAYSSTPMIIDSGTVISRLPPEVYAALSKVIVDVLDGYPRAPAYSILDTCFRGSAQELLVPEVRLIFAGGAALPLPQRNVLIQLNPITACLAFASAGQVGIIGNRQQQTFEVVYDVGRSRIGFAAGGCA